MLISDDDDDEEEILVVQAHAENNKIWLINGYGPQENDDSDSFYAKLDFVIKRAKYEGALVLIEMDANAKLGREVIQAQESGSYGRFPLHYSFNSL